MSKSATATSTTTKTKNSTKKVVKAKPTTEPKSSRRRTILDRVRDQEPIPLPSSTLMFMASRAGISNPTNSRLLSECNRTFTNSTRRITRAALWTASARGREGFTADDVLLAVELLKQ